MLHLQDHLEGKQYLGWKAIRERYAELLAKFPGTYYPPPPPGPPRGPSAERGERGGGDRDRDREKERERERWV